MKLFYYIKRFGYNALPDTFFNWNYRRLKKFEQKCNQAALKERLDYYFKVDKPFEVPKEAIAVKDFKRTRGTDYFLDLKEFFHYFTGETQFAYQFGDDTHENSYPTLFKARPIGDHNSNSILFKLNKNRHFKWVNDSNKFADKTDMLVWRGGAYKELRKEFVSRFWDNPHCNVGQTNKPKEDKPWQKDYLSISEQLKYKFIFCPEGNDVATNLKWVMSSNSLCFMPKPKFETWFMEGTLKPGIHYVEIAEDYNNLEEQILYYSKNIAEAEQIIGNAHAYVNIFRDKNMEDLLCVKVLERYAELSGQSDGFKFRK